MERQTWKNPNIENRIKDVVHDHSIYRKDADEGYYVQ